MPHHCKRKLVRRAVAHVLEPRRLLASIAGTVFYDNDLDGTIDTGDTGLGGWLVFLDSNNNGFVDGTSVTNEYTGATRAIADRTTIQVPISIFNGSGTVADIDVRVNLTHSFLQDLDIVLISPAGTRIDLTTDNGTPGQNFSNVIFDDDAAISIAGAQSTTNFTGRYRTEGSLGRLNGEAVNGTWTLEITDDSFVDTGTLFNWGITIRNGEPDATTRADGRYSIEFLAGGNYTVRPVVQANYAMQPWATQVNVTASNPNLTNINFGARLPSASISGKVFGDYDADGTLDAGEPALAGRTIFIDADNDGELDVGESSTLTDAAGNYTFTGLRPGVAYNMRTVLPFRWTQTSPAGASLMALAAPRAALAEAAAADYVQGEVLLATGNRARLADALKKRANADLADAVRLSQATLLGNVAAGELLRVPIATGVDPAKLATRLARLAGVAWASPNYVYGRAADPREYTPNDPQFPQQTFHTRIGTPTAWNVTEGAGIKVAVVDDGVLLSHPDLAPNIWTNPGEIAGNGVDDDANGYIDDVNGWDVTNTGSTHAGAGDNNPNPEFGDSHGTHVAGIIAARTNNGTNVSGVAGRATIVPVRFFGSGTWTSVVIFNAFKYAADVGARIVNTSYNVDQFVNPLDPLYQAAVDLLASRGILHVNSAGNENMADPDRVRVPGTIYVAAVDANDKKISDSNYGVGVDLSAPGELTLSTTPTGTGTMAGTSVASAVVSGVAALVWAQHPTWTREQVVAQLVGTADNTDAANPLHVGLLGAGRVSASRAVTASISAPRIGEIVGLPVDGATVVTSPTAISVRVRSVLDVATANDANNWRLASAGSDGLFGTGDDFTVALTRTSDAYAVGTNEIRFGLGSPLAPGIYRFTARSGAGGLRDPFGTPLDGNGDGTPGDDRSITFTLASRGAARVVVPSNGEAVANINFGTRETIAPVVSLAGFEYATDRQRVTLELSEATTVPTASALTLRNQTTGVLVPSQQFTVAFDAATRRLTLTMNVGVILTSGDYRLTLDDAAVVDIYGNTLDGNADNSAGGDYGFDFFFINGDFNHDRAVNFDDLLTLSQRYGQPGTFAEGDANYDGLVEFADLLIVSQGYGSQPLTAGPSTATPTRRRKPTIDTYQILAG